MDEDEEVSYPTTRPRVAITMAWALLGAIVALGLAAQVTRPVGPFDVTFAARPSWFGDSLLRLAPLGSVRLDTHDAPLRLDVRVDELRPDEAAALAEDPGRLDQQGEQLASDVRSALAALVIRGAAVAVLGGGLAAAVASRRFRLTVAGGVAGLVVVAAIGVATAATWRPEAVSEPRYSGLLSSAPSAVGDVEEVLDRFGEYRAQLAQLVGNVAALYRAGSTLPVLDPDAELVRILHVSDIHLNPQAFDIISELVQQFEIDAVADTGDITSFGTPLENMLLEGIGRLAVPYVWVRGNHDSMDTQAAVGALPNAVVLDGDRREVAGLSFFGVGDPRFTPDKSAATGKDVERDAAEAFRPRVTAMLRRDRGPVDVLLVHDQRIAGGVGGMVPIVLAGHTHEPRRGHIGSTLLLVQGTTGGAGLSNLQAERPRDLSCAVLYFDARSRRLVAYDQVVLQGLGERSVQVERHTVEPPAATRPSATSTSVPTTAVPTTAVSTTTTSRP